MPTGHTVPGLYEIRVQGRLAPRWASWFDGFDVIPGPDGTTVISGTVPDQAALHGLLQSLRDLGLPLVAVTQPAHAAPHDDGPVGETAEPQPSASARQEPEVSGPAAPVPDHPSPTATSTS